MDFLPQCKLCLAFHALFKNKALEESATSLLCLAREASSLLWLGDKQLVSNPFPHLSLFLGVYVPHNWCFFLLEKYFVAGAQKRQRLCRYVGVPCFFPHARPAGGTLKTGGVMARRDWIAVVRAGIVFPGARLDSGELLAGCSLACIAELRFPGQKKAGCLVAICLPEAAALVIGVAKVSSDALLQPEVFYLQAQARAGQARVQSRGRREAWE